MNVAALAEAVGVLAIGAGGFSFARRFGGSTALAEMERANRILERRVHELESANELQAKRITELEQRTDIALALSPVLLALQHHETAATQRAEATLGVLDLIARRLGPEPAAV